jgi:hypothetical protein
MNLATLPGPGDEATWPAYTGHPNDPRAPDDEGRDTAIDERAAELLTAPGFTPFNPANLCEAICETGDPQIEPLCRLLAEGDTAAAGEALARLARGYWEPIARKEAERQIDAEADSACRRCRGRGCRRCEAD